MLKPDSLRAAISEFLPELARDPARLKMWIDQGSLRARLSQQWPGGFAYSYRLNVVIEDLAASPSIVMLAVLNWLTANAPHLLTPGNNAFSFEADILDNNSIDLMLLLDLEEMVQVQPKVGGGYDLQHLAEPDPLFVDDLGAGGVSPIPLLTGMWTVDGEKILPDEPPFGVDVQPAG